jgi:hypothetical protein
MVCSRGIRILACSIAMLLLVVQLALSQFDATLSITQYPSPYPGEWETNPSIGSLTITNTSTEIGNVIIDLRLVRQSDGAVILKGSSHQVTVYPSPSVTILRNTQFLNLGDVTYNSGLRDKVAQTGRLPEGEYTACVDIRDVRTDRLVREGICSQTFSIVYPSAPELLYPVDGDSVSIQQPTFTWMPATSHTGFQIHYSLKIVELYPGQALAQALAANPAQCEETNLTSANLTYPQSGLPLKVGVTYVWWVQALDQNNNPATTNDGHSQICTFKYTSGIPPIPPGPITEPLQFVGSTPENASAVKDPSKLKFSVSLRPAIQLSGLMGGQLNIWEMKRRTQPLTEAMAGDAVLTVDLDSAASTIALVTHDSSSTLEIKTDTTKPKQQFTPTISKWYVWQVTLAVNPDSIFENGHRCVASPVTGTYTFQYDTTNAEPDSGACKDVCSIQVPDDQDPSSATFAVGDSIRAGRFTMVFTEVHGTGSGLTGTGEIAVPLFHTKLAVEFSGIKINKARQLIDGEIKGSHVEGSPLSKDEANGLGTSLNLSQEKIEAVHAIASNANRLVKGFSGMTPMTLPIGIDNEIGGARYVIGIIGVVFKPTAAYLNAAMSYPLPELLGDSMGIGVGARDICFSPGGFGGDGIVTMYLASDIGYSKDETWSVALLSPSGEDPGCYVTFDCKGFKKFRLNAEVKFPRTWLRPFPTDDGSSKVRATFEAVVGRGGNFLAAASMDRCEIASVPGFVLEVQDITIDHSADKNPEGMEFPRGYEGNRDDSWMGFFIKRASISLPSQLRTFDETRPPQIAVNNLLINRGGITGSFRAENIFMYPKGNFGDWGGSLDTLAVEVINSSLRRGWMTGRIKMPISETPLKYKATLSRPATGDTSRSLNYAFVLQPEDTLSADLWKARLTLSPTSTITIGNDNPERKFIASALLNGSVTVAGTLGSLPHVNFPGVGFQNLKLQSARPYFQNGTWSFASPEKSIGGFPASISHITMASTTREGKDLTGLKFALGINLSAGTNAISGSTALTLWAELDPSGASGHKFSFYGVELDSIGVNADLGPVSVAGSVNFYREDPVFGSGFRGHVRADILRRIAVTSTLQFGQVSGFRYFYVDAMGSFNPGIAFGTTGVGFYGFGGGFWWNMRREDSGEAPVPTSSSVAPDAPGSTASGFRFVPSDGAFGFKGMVVLGTYPSPAAFNADVKLEIELQRTSTGVSLGRITLQGNGYMMAELTAREKARVTCFADITYDFPTSTLHGVFNAAINAPPVTGSGQMVMHVEPNTWYVKIGEPSHRISLALASWLTTDGYLMMGKGLPPPPPPPQRVLSLLGNRTVTRDQRVSAGNGIALGASVSFSTGRQYYLIFYGEVSAGGGFDIAMLKQTRCAGINGWQAQGQLYAYVDASVGLHVDIGFYTYYPCGRWWCFFCRWCRNGYVGYRGDFEILGIHAAALLEAGGPNPLWISGTVAGKYSILGGLVKGSCSFKFSKGTECRL